MKFETLKQSKYYYFQQPFLKIINVLNIQEWLLKVIIF